MRTSAREKSAEQGATMLTGRPGWVPLTFLPDEARNLPPPKLNDPRLLYMGFMGYCSGLLDNAVRRRPVLKAGEQHGGNGRGLASQACKEQWEGAPQNQPTPPPQAPVWNPAPWGAGDPMEMPNLGT